jgi:hypothetical protein
MRFSGVDVPVPQDTGISPVVIAVAGDPEVPVLKIRGGPAD